MSSVSIIRLTDYFVEIIAYIVYAMKSAATNQLSYNQVRTDIQGLISKSEKTLKDKNVSLEDEENYDLARFAIFAWIDEMILASSWTEKGRWQTEPLQLRYYDTTKAGEWFFDKLSSLGHHQMDVREVYYLCLCMGFKGRYVSKNDELMLEALKTSNMKLLTSSSAGIPSFESEKHFPEAYPAADENISQETGKKHFSLFMIFSIAFPIMLYWVLFFIYEFVLDSFADKLIS